MERRYIFTASTGRCGEASLAALLQRHVPNAFVAFEEPQVTPVLPGALGDVERRFRRRFVETDELLGRGKVLKAFDGQDETALERFGRDKLAWIEREMTRRNAELYVDVSKHFIHGLHLPFVDALPDLGIVLLVRDPILNMRSYLNRQKDFWLDNNRPDSAVNQLRLDSDKLSPGELYLWAWCETCLRFDDLVERFALSPAVEIRTEDLNDADRMSRHLAALRITHEPITVIPPQNTNVGSGYDETAVRREDIETFERFIGTLPSAIRARIGYLDDYDPWARHGRDLAA